MRILCLDIPAPGASLEKYAPHLNAEALHAWGLYKSGFIRDIYFRQDRPGVAIFLECDSVDEAMADKIAQQKTLAREHASRLVELLNSVVNNPEGE